MEARWKPSKQSFIYSGCDLPPAVIVRWTGEYKAFWVRVDHRSVGEYIAGQAHIKWPRDVHDVLDSVRQSGGIDADRYRGYYCAGYLRESTTNKRIPVPTHPL